MAVEQQHHDPVAVAIIEAVHALGFHLSQIARQLQRVADTLDRLSDGKP